MNNFNNGNKTYIEKLLHKFYKFRFIFFPHKHKSETLFSKKKITNIHRDPLSNLIAKTYTF